MDMSIIGTGYVGLVAGACFASQGHRVVCADIDSEKIAGLRLGVLPIFEPGLDERVRSEQAGGRLSFTDSVPDAVRNSDIAFIAVGTPPKPDGSSDLSWVLKAADAVASTQTGAGTIVIKSTVPVGTADLLRDHLASRTGRPLTVINNPEFLREGRAIEDFLHPRREWSLVWRRDRERTQLTG